MRDTILPHVQNRMIELVNPKKQNVIYFVCTGNTCRSAMAHAIALNLVRTLNYPFNIDSFGIRAKSGSPASDHSITAIHEIGKIHTIIYPTPN
jgi:protein-tyrosine-phosphatase